MLTDPGVDTVLAIYVPPIVTTPLEVATAIVKGTETAMRDLAARGESPKPILTCFMGAHGVPEGLRSPVIAMLKQQLSDVERKAAELEKVIQLLQAENEQLAEHGQAERTLKTAVNSEANHMGGCHVGSSRKQSSLQPAKSHLANLNTSMHHDFSLAFGRIRAQ